MQASDEAEFAILIDTLAAALGREIEPALIDAYFEALADLELVDVASACREAVRTCEFFPKPVQLRRLAGEDDIPTRALHAWEKMATRKYKERRHPDDPIATQAFTLLGPMDLEKHWEGPWAQKRFLENYERLAESHQIRERLLAGRPAVDLLTGGGE